MTRVEVLQTLALSTYAEEYAFFFAKAAAGARQGVEGEEVLASTALRLRDLVQRLAAEAAAEGVLVQETADATKLIDLFADMAKRSDDEPRVAVTVHWAHVALRHALEEFVTCMKGLL